MSSVEAVSKAIACLRVLVREVPGRPASAELNALVGKLINAFLETRWIWPRQFNQMTPYAFILSDPRVQELDKQALQILSRELQLKLFGVSGSGEVSLLVFEGDEMEVHRFAGLDLGELDRLVHTGDARPPFEGHLSRVTPTGAQPIKLKSDEPAWDEAAVSFSTPKFERNYEPLYRGQYFVPTRRFFGNLALCKPIAAKTIKDLLVGAHVLPGVPTEEFDEACVESASAALSQASADGLMFVPLNFSSLVRPAGRRAYAEFLARLPSRHKAKLVASIYETPRDPSFFALNQMVKYLSDYFGQINLVVADPAFEVEKLAQGMVSSVSLVLPELDGPSRIASIRLFMRQRELFKRKQIWPGVTRVVNRAELEACMAMRVPAVSGPAVTDFSTSPVPAMEREFDALPLR